MYNRSRGSGGRKNEIMEEPWQGPLGFGVGVRREAFGGYKAGTGLQAEEGETEERRERDEGERRGARSEAAAANGPKKVKRAGGRKNSGGKKKRKKKKKCEGRGF